MNIASGRPETNIDSKRLEAFSDGVMAVIITIMAFELHAPKGFTLTSARHELPSLLIYILSFLFVGIYWNNHHHLLRATPRISAGVMWANLFLLFWLSLIPVATEWIGQDYKHEWPAAMYGVIGCGAGTAYYILVRWIKRTNGHDSQIAAAIGSDFKGIMSLVLYIAGIGLSFVSPWIAYALYLCVSIIWFVPDRRVAF